MRKILVMLLNALLATLLGVLFGIITGVVPGMHPNTIAVLIPASIYNFEAAVFLFSCLVSSNVFAFLSACYLGVPEEGEVLARMPLQKMLMDKRSLAAMKIVAFSSVITYAAFLGISFLLEVQLENIYFAVRSYAWLILVGICLHLIIKEKDSKIALLLFLTAGVIGIISFNTLSDPFLPMLSGLFGISTLLSTGTENKKIPKQMRTVVVDSGFFGILAASVTGIIASIVMMIVPSMSPSQVGLLTEEFKSGKETDELKIAGMTSINVADNVLSLMALLVIGKARSGVVEKIGSILPLTLENYNAMLFAGFLACIISAYLLIKMALFVSERVHWFNNRWTIMGVMFFVSLLVLLMDGSLGIVILVASTVLGYVCIRKDVRRSQLLGCLVVPTILFYLGF